MGKIILAVDIGGTKIATAAITLDGRILQRLAAPTLQKGPVSGIQQIVALLEGLISQAELDRTQCLGIGIGIPAVLEPGTDRIIWGPNLQGWRDVDLRGPLEAHFDLPVCIEYDGHTAVMGEWWAGAGKGYDSVVSVIIGTGLGGGMILEKNLIRGKNRLAGAAGWFVLNPGDESDQVRERALGSWESRTAGPGIARRASQLLEEQAHIDSVLRGEKNVSAENIFMAAKQNDPIARQVVEEEAELLGAGIANIVSLVNPEIIVLGGSVGSNSAMLLSQIRSVVGRYAQPISSQSVQIVPSQLGGDAGLYGAAYGLMLRLNIRESI